MKKLLFACLLAVGTVTAYSQDTTSVNQGAGSSEYGAVQDDSKDYTEKEQIQASELPAVISDQLKSADYAGWTVGNAYRKEKEGKTMFAVELSNGTETKMVKFDAQGNKVKEKMKDKDK